MAEPEISKSMSTATEKANSKNSGKSIADESAELASLKEILFRDERDELATLQKQLEESQLDEDSLAELLPGAVRTSSAQDEQLGSALGPLIGSALGASIKQDPEQVVDAISPIMGPAIRNSIRQAIEEMTQSLNKAMEYSVSPKGLKWRWEAFTTGKSFAEVVLINTLLYRVVELFLIHEETGLLIQHASIKANENPDADLTSSMLTAIQDFARDSFGADADESLNTVSIGDQTIWIQSGPHAYLAAVIEGEAPSAYRVQMQECLEKTHRDYAKPLEEFNGDNRQFASLKPLLGDYLNSAFEEDEKKEKEQPKPEKDLTKKAGKWPWILGSLAFLAGIWLLMSWQGRREQLQNATRLLAKPDAVSLEIEKGTLYISGEARHDWIGDTRRLAPRLLDFDSVDTSQLTNLDQPWIDYLSRLRALPGIIVTSSEQNNGQYTIEGIWDPVSDNNPERIMKDFAINSANVTHRWSVVRLSQ